MNMLRTESRVYRYLTGLLAPVVLYVAQFAAATSAHAATACIAANTNLYNTFNAIENSSDATTINLEEGTYDLGALDLTFKSPIQIVGGFKPGTLCASHEEDPAKTIIDFGGADVNLIQKRGSPALLAFSNLTLRDGVAMNLKAGDEAVPPFLGQHDFPGQITMNHVRVTNFSYLYSFTFYGGVKLTDVLFDHLTGGGCVVQTALSDSGTFVFDHVTADLTGGTNFCLGDDGYDEDRYFTIANSIFWSSDGKPTAIVGLNNDGNAEFSHVTIDHVLFKSFSGIAGDINVKNQINSDPQWINPAAGDYRLKTPPQTLSPAINAGTNVANVLEPSTDIVGNPRKIGSNTDLGAYESLYTDSSVFNVTNATDCGTAGCGSLRDAINGANASGAPSVSINFNIAGGCPAVINLNSPLPDIIKPVTIDGYTQPNSSVNTDPLAFNATLCVVLRPVSEANSYYALRVPANSNGALTLRGIAMGDFPVDVELFGGANHQIVGNQFGGYINNYSFQLFGSTVNAIYLDAPGGQASIGGVDVADHNAFLNVFSYGQYPAVAISIGPDVNGPPGVCQIIGNTLGIQDDGSFSSTNLNYGIYTLGKNCLISGNTIVGVTKDAIFVDGAYGGGGNVVQSNTIGVAPRGNLAGTNLGVGIRLSGDNNVIGSPIAGAAVSNGNTILNMDGGGVVVTGLYTYGNTIRANWMQDNGPSHNGMSIDLGGDGPTPNDVYDGDVGPNEQQNFPTLHSIAWPVKPGVGTTFQTVTVNGALRSLSPDNYQIDVYFADGCDATGKGIAQQWIGSNEKVALPSPNFLVPFSVNAVIPVYVPGYGAISATATSIGIGSTSEVSACFPVDGIFRDNLEGGVGFD